MPIIYQDIDELIDPEFLEINKGPAEKWGDLIEDWNAWKRMDEYEQWNSIQHKKIERELVKAQCYPVRGRITKTRLAAILNEELQGRLLNYTNPDMKKRILCIVGESGVGKTLVSLHLKNKLGANTICSYTTRPPRENEVEGRDHHFVDILPPREELLAYTYFGGFEYYATRAQVQGPCTVYVIDEAGLRDFKGRWSNEYEVFSLYLMRDKKLRQKLKIGAERMRRDKERETFDLSHYDYIVTNNGSKKELFEQIDRIYMKLAKEQV